MSDIPPESSVIASKLLLGFRCWRLGLILWAAESISGWAVSSVDGLIQCCSRVSDPLPDLADPIIHIRFRWDIFSLPHPRTGMS